MSSTFVHMYIRTCMCVLCVFVCMRPLMMIDSYIHIVLYIHRLLAFEDNWVLLEVWFSQFNNLVIVDANENEGNLEI